jgi:hypothetical protein
MGKQGGLHFIQSIQPSAALSQTIRLSCKKDFISFIIEAWHAYSVLKEIPLKNLETPCFF